MNMREALEEIEKRPEIKITHAYKTVPGGGYRRFIMPNGWVASVGFGPLHYCSNRFVGMGEYRNPKPFEELLKTEDVELAIFTPSGDWFQPHEEERSPWGHVSVDLLMEVIWDLYHRVDDGMPCPCPECVEKRLEAGAK